MKKCGVFVLDIDVLEWGYVSFWFNVEWMLCVGCVNVDVFLMVDYCNVGYVFFIVCLLVEFYVWLFMMLDGVDVVCSWFVGDV